MAQLVRPGGTPKFVKTNKQREALDLVNSHAYSLLRGGARSGKTVIFIRNVFLRAIMRRSTHLLLRQAFAHAKKHLGMQTIPYVLDACFPGYPIEVNKSDWYYKVPAKNGGESIIWLGGVDDPSSWDKALGSEYSTIMGDECNAIAFDAISLLDTRLAENSGLDPKFYLACNPPVKANWTHKVFVEGIFPSGEKCNWDTCTMLMNPRDNEQNLPAGYLAKLASLPKKQRDRFLEGLWGSDAEGALWSEEMVNRAVARDHGELTRIVVAVDPSTTNNPGSDECGIVVCAEDHLGDGVVLEDLSGKFSTRTWAQRAVNAYYDYHANCIVAEVNQGGDLVEDAIHSIDHTIKVEKVRASNSKRARAEPVSALYEPAPDTKKTRISHVKRMPLLETELTETNLNNVRCSPNRLDALVWGLTFLILGDQPEVLFV